MSTLQRAAVAVLVAVVATLGPRPAGPASAVPAGGGGAGADRRPRGEAVPGRPVPGVAPRPVDVGSEDGPGAADPDARTDSLNRSSPPPLLTFSAPAPPTPTPRPR